MNIYTWMDEYGVETVVFNNGNCTIYFKDGSRWNAEDFDDEAAIMIDLEQLTHPATDYRGLAVTDPG